MGLEDLFENKRRYVKYNYHEDNFNPHYRYEDRYSGRMPGKEHYLLFIIDKIWNNRKLRLLLILSIIILIVIVITALVLIIPLIVRIIDSVSQTGLRTVFEDISGLISKLWNGSGN
jgi:hypothetical protein